MSDIEKSQDSILMPAKQANLQTFKNIGFIKSKENLNNCVLTVLGYIEERIKAEIYKRNFSVCIGKEDVLQTIKMKCNSEDTKYVLDSALKRVKLSGYKVEEKKSPRKGYSFHEIVYGFIISWDDV